MFQERDASHYFFIGLIREHKIAAIVRAISVKFMTTSVHLFPYLHFLIYSGKMFWKHRLSPVQEPSILLERTHLIDGLHHFNDIKAQERDQEKTCL